MGGTCKNNLYKRGYLAAEGEREVEYKKEE